MSGSPFSGLYYCYLLLFVLRVISYSVESDSLDPLDYSPPDSSVYRIFQARTIAHQTPPSIEFSRQEYQSGCHFLLQGMSGFPPDQGSDPGLQHCRQTLYCLSPRGSPNHRVGKMYVYSLKRKASGQEIEHCQYLRSPFFISSPFSCGGLVTVVFNSLDLMDYSLPGSSVHGIFRARILEWFAVSFSSDFSDPGIEHGSPALQAGSLPTELLGKPFSYSKGIHSYAFYEKSFLCFILYRLSTYICTPI